ncbi:MAG: ribosomal protein S18-alanine N-acetyltransferase [Acidimicrobiia bacterium]|nr:ribosomal protein S18-alanine N-acetyltransferase [Acidimicrobiia bacterium]MDH4362710.1 ribosomal protein S18-alanine N-acetyltransferase [Acidimicrobiia bacterium]MDH5288742.1 ribosomal protein S18-alanine N-acetyltransferase [Acidimicrobiia bacterium]
MSSGPPPPAAPAGAAHPARVRLRELRRRDLRAVTAIEADRNRDPWSRTLFAGELDRAGDDRHWLVASAGVTVVGFGGVMYAADEAHMLNLAVARNWSGWGIGRRLCEALLAGAARRAASGFTLEVRASNTVAQALYASLGFDSAGVRPGYYPDGEDAVIMWLHDLAPYADPGVDLLAPAELGPAATGPTGLGTDRSVGEVVHEKIPPPVGHEPAQPQRPH